MLILVLNCGSSSVKYQLYDMPQEICLVKGIVEKIVQEKSFLNYQLKNKKAMKINVKTTHHNAAVRLVIQNLQDPRKGAGAE